MRQEPFLFSPVSATALLSVEIAMLKNTLPALTANSVGYFSDLVMLFYAVAIFAAVLERYAVDDEMIVRVIM